MGHWWQSHHLGDNATWTQATTWQTGKTCEYRWPWNGDIFMKLIKRKDYSSGKTYLNTLCLQTFNNRMTWAYRSRTPRGVGFVRECIELNEVWNARKRRCVPVTKNCKTKTENQKACATCDTGFEIQIKGKDGWKPRRWFSRMKKIREYRSLMYKPGKTRCRPCDHNHVWNPVIKECREKIKPNRFIYHVPQVSDSGKHYFFNIRRHYNQKVAALTFEMDIKNITAIEGDVLVKVHLQGANKQIPCDSGDCFYKRLKNFKGLDNKKCAFTHNIHNWVMHRNWNKRYCRHLNRYKTTNSVRWFTELTYDKFFDKFKLPYLKVQGSFVMRKWQPDYAITVELFNPSGVYDQLFVSDLKYRIDYKGSGGKRNMTKTPAGDTIELLRKSWDWNTRQIPYAYKYIGVDKTMKVKKPKKSKEDFSYYQTKLKKDKPINMRYRYLINNYNTNLTVQQFWFKLDPEHLNEADISLMVMKFKRVMTYKPVYYSIHGNGQTKE